MIPAALCGGGAVFCGTERLISRGVGVYEDILRPRGIEFSVGKTEIGVSGRLSPGEYSIPGGVSSQFISGMLFALPMLGGYSTVNVIPPFESRGYVDITVAAQRRFGVTVEQTGENGFFIRGGQSYLPADVTVEGDWSQAAFFYALEADGGAGTVTVTGLDPDSLQGDREILRITEEFIRTGKGFDINASQIPDLVPIMSVLACFGEGTSYIRGCERLRIKECDRLAVTSGELSKLGADIRVEGDTLVIKGVKELKGGECECWTDHRIAMSISIASQKCASPVILKGAECVSKSYPTFFDDFKMLGGKFDVI